MLRSLKMNNYQKRMARQAEKELAEQEKLKELQRLKQEKAEAKKSLQNTLNPATPKNVNQSEFYSVSSDGPLDNETDHSFVNRIFGQVVFERYSILRMFLNKPHNVALQDSIEWASKQVQGPNS